MFVPMRNDCDIICFTLSRWDAGISSPALSLAKEFAKNNRVFFIEHPFSWKDYWVYRNTPYIKSRHNALLWKKNIYSQPDSLPENLKIVTAGLTLPVNSLSPGYLYEKLSAYNDKIVLTTIRKVIKDYQLKRFIYINFFDPYFVRSLPADIRPVVSVYQSMDDISQVSYSNRHGTRLEEEIIRNFDLTLCTSKELTRLKSAFSSNVHFHPNAADTDIFNTAVTETLPRPAELKAIAGKIIGFTGSIEYRSDFELIKKIALHHHDKTLCFVGPILGEELAASGIDKLPNVIFTGSKKIGELPAYLQYFDCVIIPYRKTVLTKSIYPLKINEYLAAGKPVIATHFSEDIYTFREVAYIADSHEEFLQMIDQAISENSAERIEARMKVAAKNSWKIRVEEFWNIISRQPSKQHKG